MDDYAYFNLRISKLCHRNSSFPRRTDVYTLATKNYNSLPPFRLGYYSLRNAHEMALSGGPLFLEDVATDMVKYVT